MKKNGSTLKSSIIGIVVCFICVGIVILYPKKEEKIQIDNELVDQEEIALGDKCKTMKCKNSSHTLIGVRCYSRTNIPQVNCTSSGQTYTNGACYNYAANAVCDTCNDGAYLNGDSCTACTVSSISFPTLATEGTASTASYSSTCTNLKVTCTNATCTINKTKKTVSFTPTKACVDVKITLTDGSVSKTETKTGNSIRRPWFVVYRNTNVISTMAESASNADAAGTDYYGTGCSAPVNGSKKCETVYQRTNCNGGSAGNPSVSTPTPTPPPTYDYCCVKSDKSDYSWKTGQTSKTCPNDYSVDTTITSSADCSLACYKKSTGELIWTNKSSTGTKTDKTKATCKNCYMNKSTWETSTEAIYTSYDNKPVTINNYAGEIEEKNCEIPPKIEYCDIKDYVNKATDKSTGSCEADGTEISYEEGKTCDGYKYYKIECTNTITVTRFDNNDDGMYGNQVVTTNTIYPGQGFAFGISARVIRTCEGTFYSDKWKNDYNTLNNSLSKLQNETNINWVNNAMGELKEFVNDYNTYGYANATDLGGSFSVSYDTYTSDKKEVLKTNFAVKEPVYEGTGKFTSQTALNLGVSGVVNPKNYRWSNEENPKIIRMYFPIAYIDKATGVVTDQKTGIIGGNKLYTKGSAKAGENNMAITLYSPSNAVIEDSYAKITNNACKLKIIIPDVKYRPMNVTNPFINNEYEKGHNWVNEHYDFTKIIEPDIWTRSPETVVDLKASDIVELQSNNASYIKSGNSPYYGLCNTKIIQNDNLAKKLCEKLNIK